MRAPALALSILASSVLSSCLERPETPHTRSTAAAVSRPRDVVLSTAPQPKHLVNAIFDNQIELVGYDVTPEPANHRERVVVAVYYRAMEDLTDDWQIFVHAEDTSRIVPRFNIDHWPGGDRARTIGWHKGDYIRDEYTLQYPDAVANLEIWTGFYQGDARLPLTVPGAGRSDGVNRLRMGSIAAR